MNLSYLGNDDQLANTLLHEWSVNSLNNVIV